MNNMNLKPFTKGDPRINKLGRPTGSSKKVVAINAIFEIMDKYQDRFKEELNTLANKNILEFYERFLKPLQPKTFDLNFEFMDTHKYIEKDDQIENLRNDLIKIYSLQHDPEIAETIVGCVQNNLSFTCLLDELEKNN